MTTFSRSYRNGREEMKIKTLYSIALGALLLISTGGDAVSKTTVIKLATLAPEGSAWTEIFNGLAGRFETGEGLDLGRCPDGQSNFR